MFLNILYAVDDDSKYLVMEKLLQQTESLALAFLDRQLPDDIAAGNIDPAQYDLLLVESRLENAERFKTGEELLRSLYDSGNETPAVLLTGTDDPQVGSGDGSWSGPGRVVSLPAGHLTAEQLDAAVHNALNANTLRILIIEDDDDDYRILCTHLPESKEIAVETEQARTIEEAWPRIESDEHDLYLVDYQLGPEVATSLVERMVAAGNLKPIILVTGHAAVDTDPAMSVLLQRDHVSFLSKQSLSTEAVANALRLTDPAGGKDFDLQQLASGIQVEE